MAWFDNKYTFDKSYLRIGHITDCHLFGDKNAEYFGVNTYQHFTQALEHMAHQQLDAVIFGGDLTQDHSVASYSLFAQLIAQSALTCPVFWVPGNHDEIAQLNAISRGQIQRCKYIQAKNVALILINSKGDTPAGWVSALHLEEISHCLKHPHTHIVVFCHHNPLPINGYLDRHILENGPQLLNLLANTEHVKALVHGHVHNDYHFKYRGLDVFATPASSVQFTKNTPKWQQQNCGAAYRIMCLDAAHPQGQISTDVIWLNA